MAQVCIWEKRDTLPPPGEGRGEGGGGDDMIHPHSTTWGKEERRRKKKKREGPNIQRHQFTATRNGKEKCGLEFSFFAFAFRRLFAGVTRRDFPELTFLRNKNWGVYVADASLLIQL